MTTLGTAVIALIFVLALVLLLVIRQNRRRMAVAVAAHSPTLPDQRAGSSAPLEFPGLRHDNEASAALPGIIIATLAAQKTFVSIASGTLPERARDHFSIGYIGGYTNAILQLKGVQSAAVVESISNHVFAAAFSNDDGGSLYQKYLVLKLAGDQEVMAGKHLGDSDIMCWLRNNANVPLGWSDHVLGAVGAQTPSAGSLPR